MMSFRRIEIKNNFATKSKPFNDEFSLHRIKNIFPTKGKPLVVIS